MVNLELFDSEILNTDLKRNNHRKIVRERGCREEQNTQRYKKRTKSLGFPKDAVYM